MLSQHSLGSPSQESPHSRRQSHRDTNHAFNNMFSAGLAKDKSCSLFDTPQSMVSSPSLNNSGVFGQICSPNARFMSPMQQHSFNSSCGLCGNRCDSNNQPGFAECSHQICSECVPMWDGQNCPACLSQRFHGVRLSDSEPMPMLSGLRSLDSAASQPLRLDIWSDEPKQRNNVPPAFDNSLDVSQEPQHTPLFPSKTPCAACGEHVCASHCCIECREFLCAECVDAHSRVRVTRDHTVFPVEHFAHLFQQQLQLSSPARAGSLSNAPSSSPDDSIRSSVCALHDATAVCECLECGTGAWLCTMCVMQQHPRHRLSPIGDTAAAVSTLLAECRQEERILEEAGDACGLMAERVEAVVQAVTSEILTSFHCVVSALEERKRKLLHKVETIRAAKQLSLNRQLQQLRQRQSGFIKAIEGVDVNPATGELDESKLAGSFDALFHALCTSAVPLQPTENDYLQFIQSEQHLKNLIRLLGTLQSGPSAMTSELIGDSRRKAVREHACVVQLCVRDACGDEVADGARHVRATVLGPLGRGSVELHVVKAEGGVCQLSYVPVTDGVHTLNLTIGGVHVVGSPLLLEVRRGRSYAEAAVHGEKFSFGGEGCGDGELCRPWGICIDKRGRVLVADRSNNRVQMFDLDGKFITKFGSPGNRAGQFDRPAGITCNSLNQMIVADKDNHRVQVFDEDGNFVLKFGERGRQMGMFNYPWGVAVNAADHIAVSDTRNHRVQIFNSSGQFVRKCGFDSPFFYKHLDSPRGLCFLSDGQLLITDFNKHRVAVMSSRQDMKCYGGEGEEDGLYCRPQGIAVDQQGHVLVCDSRNNRVQVLAADDMRVVATLGGPDPSAVSAMPVFPPSPDAPSTDSLLDRPTDVAVAPDGRIYVVDFGHNCVRVF